MSKAVLDGRRTGSLATTVLLSLGHERSLDADRWETGTVR